MTTTTGPNVTAQLGPSPSSPAGSRYAPPVRGSEETAETGGTRVLHLEGSGRPLSFPAVWLRDNCPCPDCSDPVSGQKLHSVTDLSPETAIASSKLRGSTVMVCFAPDGHRSVFSTAWLRAHALDGRADPDARTAESKRLWRAADFSAGPPRLDWEQLLADEAHLERCLRVLLEDGFVLLQGVPAEPGSVLRVAGTLGYVRETNYGRLFDVRVKPDPSNLAYSGRAIRPHTDNPYRDPVPTLQLLHCLETSSAGGDSGVVDGFETATRLRQNEPAAFAALTSTPVRWRYEDADTVLEASGTLVTLDAAERICGVRFNNRSMQAVRLRAAAVVTFYEAYRAFAEMLYDEAAMVPFRLEPGDCLVLDNTRVLHARTAFAGGGGETGRHLQGCYADIDAVVSRLAVLRQRRATAPASP